MTRFRGAFASTSQRLRLAAFVGVATVATGIGLVSIPAALIVTGCAVVFAAVTAAYVAGAS